jgi:hypothetical protein
VIFQIQIDNDLVVPILENVNFPKSASPDFQT